MTSVSSKLRRDLPIIYATTLLLPLILASACGTGNPMGETSSSNSQITSNPLEPIEQAAAATPGSVDQAPIPVTVPVMTALPGEQPGTALPSEPGNTAPDNSPPAAVVLDPGTPVSCSAPVSHMQQRTLELINAARAVARMCGNESFAAAEPLAWNATLETAAKTQSDDMAENNFFSHTGSDGSTIGTRVSQAGYVWQAVGENIAAGQSTASLTVQGWINSPGHCRNLMSANFTEVAVSCSENSGSDYSRYWTNVLAAPR